MFLLLTENLRNLPYLPYWIVVLIFIQLGLLLYLYLYFPKIILLPFLSLIDKRVRRELIESKNAFQSRILAFMDVMFYMNVSFLILFLTSHHFSNFINNYIKLFSPLRNIVIYILILVSVFFFSIFKKQTFLFIAYLFNDMRRYYIFTFNMSMFLKSTGLFLFPFVFIYLWGNINSDIILYFILGIIIIYLLLLIVSFFSITEKSFIDYLNFILYFCGLEIIPILIIFKFLLLYTNG